MLDTSYELARMQVIRQLYKPTKKPNGARQVKRV